MNRIVQDPNDPKTFLIEMPGDYDEKEIEAFQKGFEAGREFTLDLLEKGKE